MVARQREHLCSNEYDAGEGFHGENVLHQGVADLARVAHHKTMPPLITVTPHPPSHVMQPSQVTSHPPGHGILNCQVQHFHK